MTPTTEDSATAARSGGDQADALRRMTGADGSAIASTTAREAPGTQTGRISFGPRSLTATTPVASMPNATPVRLARAIAVASGKGGVGKSNLAVNLCAAMASLGARVVLLDADLGLANADVLCGLTPRVTLDDVVAGRATINAAMIAAPGGFRLVPGASGVARLANLPMADRNSLLRQLESIERMADVIVIDTGAGIGPNVIGFAAAAHAALVVVTPEPTSITDAYATVKALSTRGADVHVDLLVNMTTRRGEGQDVHARIARVAERFLHRQIGLAGMVPFDPALRDAVRRRHPVTLLHPRSPSSRAFHALAARSLEQFMSSSEAAELGGGDPGRRRPHERPGLFARLARIMRRSGPASERHRLRGGDA